MVKAQCDLRFGFGDEFVFRFVPRRDLFADAEAQQQRLIGQGNRRAPFNSEDAEVVRRRSRPRCRA